MARSAPRRSLRTRVGVAALAAAVALGGQLAGSGPARAAAAQARAAAPALIQSHPSLVYIDDTGNFDGGDIKVLDPATDTIVSTILDVKHPLGLAVSPDGSTLYTQGDSGAVVAIDTESQAIRATLPVTGPVQGAWLAVDPAGKSLYVGGSEQLTVVDTHTDAVTATIPVAGSVIGLFVDPSGGHVYAILQNIYGPLKIAVIDTATETVTGTITSFIGPSAVVFNASGTRAYIPDDVANTVSVLDTATYSVLTTIPVGKAPSAAALTPSGAKLYVTNPGDQTLSVIDTATATVTATITSPVSWDIGVVMNADGTKAYVNNNTARTVSVIDTATDTITGSVPVGFYPQHMAVYNGNGGKCPCSVFKEYATPDSDASGDFYPVTVGVKVSPSAAGWIEGIRFYKASANTGTHTGALWTGDGGQLLATGTFTDETASGWQTLIFANPVPVKPGATYVASYYAPNGHYSYDAGYFLNSSAGEPPITAVSSSAGGNGVYTYDGPTAFPGYSYNAPNYWVDVIFDDARVPTTPPTVTGTAPAAGATGASATAPITATVSAPVDTATVHFTVAAAGTQVPGTVSYNSTDTTVTFTPSTQLPAGTLFTASIQASDAWGSAMSHPVTWNFTTSTTPPSYQCPCSLFPATGTPPGVVDSNDPNSVELGIRFVPAVNGTVTGIRFYKGANASGVHTGTLWNDATGTAIATGTFTNETASGWQTMTFANPVPVTAGIAYHASYHALNGHYSYTTGYFTYEHQTYPLTAPASTSEYGNGTYGYGSPITFPGASGNGTNFWVDPVFTAS
ncbi:MAG: DUF4082 domain-containing protein [Catenulispora sp.]|nr:DUF4082 domain-containing protein [Catenulispora sp.]